MTYDDVCQAPASWVSRSWPSAPSISCRMHKPQATARALQRVRCNEMYRSEAWEPRPPQSRPSESRELRTGAAGAAAGAGGARTGRGSARTSAADGSASPGRRDASSQASTALGPETSDHRRRASNDAATRTSHWAQMGAKLWHQSHRKRIRFSCPTLGHCMGFGKSCGWSLVKAGRWLPGSSTAWLRRFRAARTAMCITYK